MTRGSQARCTRTAFPRCEFACVPSGGSSLCTPATKTLFTLIKDFTFYKVPPSSSQGTRTYAPSDASQWPRSEPRRPGATSQALQPDQPAPPSPPASPSPPPPTLRVSASQTGPLVPTGRTLGDSSEPAGSTYFRSVPIGRSRRCFLAKRWG